MKRKINLLTLAICMLLVCGCSKNEPQPTADTTPPVPSAVGSIVSTQPTEAEIVCETEAAEPQEPVATDGTVTTETATEAIAEQTEEVLLSRKPFR